MQEGSTVETERRGEEAPDKVDREWEGRNERGKKKNEKQIEKNKEMKYMKKRIKKR